LLDQLEIVFHGGNMAGPTSETDSAAGAQKPAAAAETSGTLNAHLLKEKLEEAELLLSYAVESGVQVEPAVSRSILEAGAASRAGWTEQAGTNLLTAEATLSAILKPVSVESLRNSARYRLKSLKRRVALPVTMGILAAVIVFYSTAAFLFSAFSTKIRDNITIANPLAVKLVDELGSSEVTNDKLCPNTEAPAGPQLPGNSDSSPRDGTQKKYVISDLQTFAAAIRDMYGAAKQLNRLYPFSSRQQDPIVPADKKPFTPDDYAKVLELPAGLPDLALAATERVCVYQRVRYYAQSTEENATVYIGAVAAGILPVHYALLGAGAYVLRRLESQLRSRTFIDETHSPRFITAAIAGAVVGLFNFGQSVSVSPLAIAFLAGYAVDVFFTLLESMIQSLSKGKGGTGSDQATPSGKS
jgi:hypothetical protein